MCTIQGELGGRYTQHWEDQAELGWWKDQPGLEGVDCAEEDEDDVVDQGDDDRHKGHATCLESTAIKPGSELLGFLRKHSQRFF